MEKPQCIPIKTHKLKKKKKDRETFQVMEESGYFCFFFQYTFLTTRLIILVYSSCQTLHCCKQPYICILLEYENGKTAMFQAWSIQYSLFASQVIQIHTNGLVSKELIWQFWQIWSVTSRETGKRVSGTQNCQAMALLSHPLSKHLSLTSPMQDGMK